MNKFFIILFHTFFTKLKSKSFIVSTLITAVIIVGIANIDRIFEAFESGGAADRTVSVVEEGDQGFADRIRTEAEALGISTDDAGGLTPGEAEEMISNGDLEAALIVSADASGLPQAVYKAPSIADERTAETLRQAVQTVKEEVAASRIGIDEQTLEQVYAPVNFTAEAVSDTARSQEELDQARFLVNALVVVIYFSVLAYGNMIAMEVAAEKTSRVMEILVSSVSPVKQMFAKIFGIALLGITQYILIITVGLISVAGNAERGGYTEVIAAEIPVGLLVYAFIFFLLGYLFYATISAVLGSLVSRTEEVNIVITPLTLIVVVAFLISMFGINAPESPIITGTSYIPFFTPMVMFLRVGMTDLPVWELAAGMGIMVISIVLLALAGARIYKGGVLMYGKVSSIKDIRQALAISKKEQ
ncbi:ABC transporter permease [Alteribacter natronophilus]|uniref:ABC transporter permease n=1 Tax=Alteribacter natronophilus TaxID=2583810 RepID=UPI00110E5178|nr:ABC transporter permease [Alteribacter natronophilus]TMW74021.1 ABC transporter permease [Alteribacter natronophilus]